MRLQARGEVVHERPPLKKGSYSIMATEEVASKTIDPKKSKALDMALSNIEKQFGKGSVVRLGQAMRLNVDAISTGSIALDMALGIGGIPRGRITEIYGTESSGKT